ncbi:hypothetical protein ACLB2K_011779 [Fragaria x ananassa]
MKVCKGYVRNRARPEGCIAENYIAEEAVEFLAERLLSDKTIGIPKQRSKDCRRTSGAKISSIYGGEFKQAHLCVLQNTEEFSSYFLEHMEYLKATFPTFKKNKKWLKDEQNKTFADWVKKRVEEQLMIPENNISETVRWIAAGPCHEVAKFSSYIVDGAQFYTKLLDDVRACQNSGVYLEADTMVVASARDTNPKVQAFPEETECKLALGSTDHFVALATLCTNDDPSTVCHGYALGDDKLRVSIHTAIEEKALIPFPVGDEIKTVKQAMGSWVMWPKNLIIYNENKVHDNVRHEDDSVPRDEQWAPGQLEERQRDARRKDKGKGIHFQSLKKGQITMDIDFRCGGDPNIVLGVEAVLVASIPIQLKDLQVFTVVRVIFQVFEEIPCISAVVVALLTEPKPRIDYTVKAVGGSLTALPGISDMIDADVLDIPEIPYAVNFFYSHPKLYM